VFNNFCHFSCKSVFIAGVVFQLFSQPSFAEQSTYQPRDQPIKNLELVNKRLRLLKNFVNENLSGNFNFDQSRLQSALSTKLSIANCGRFPKDYLKNRLLKSVSKGLECLSKVNEERLMDSIALYGMFTSPRITEKINLSCYFDNPNRPDSFWKGLSGNSYGPEISTWPNVDLDMPVDFPKEEEADFILENILFHEFLHSLGYVHNYTKSLDDLVSDAGLCCNKGDSSACDRLPTYGPSVFRSNLMPNRNQIISGSTSR
jgi:hypothetical protein